MGSVEYGKCGVENEECGGYAVRKMRDIEIEEY